LVLWYFQAEALQLSTIQTAINELIKFAIIDKNTGVYNYNKIALEMEQDNEFDLVFVVGYQNFLQLSYIDRLLSEVKKKFRDMYKNRLESGFSAHLSASYDSFSAPFEAILAAVEQLAKTQGPAKPRKWEESGKSVRSVKGSGLIETKEEAKTRKNAESAKGDQLTEDDIKANLDKLRTKHAKSPKNAREKSDGKTGKGKGKAPRKWDGEGKQKEQSSLDFSKNHDKGAKISNIQHSDDHEIKGHFQSLKGAVRDLDIPKVNLESEEASKSSSVFGMFKGLIGQKELTEDAMKPMLDKYREHLISKNVASEIAERIIDSVKSKLIGQTIGTFASIKTAVFNGIEESLVQILTPRRRVDILRDVLAAKSEKRPYTITFCGVNGVGKSTNLAKICFWLVENGFRIMIAACDTFRAGAVEQLKTHVHRINGIHPDKVKLFEQGYGKDAATIAMHAISAARDQKYDVVLIDTAGRMQDNEPLMRALSKLIAINRPDAVLFVGEALVGNDAVDQLTKFNQALANHSQSKDPRLIDGIVLSKFDTIDDKVGAAISMTYTTGQPIVFIGTGQTYKDLRALNPRAVVNSLLR